MSIVSLAAKGRDDKLRSALEKDPTRVNETNKGGMTALHAAVDSAEEECVAVLLEHEADLAATDRDGLTPLMLAASQGSEPIAMTLACAAGEKLRARDATGQNLAHVAVRRGLATLLETVVRRQPALLKEKEEVNELTPVLMAASLGHTEMLAELLAARGEPVARAVREDRDADGNSALHWAIRKGDHEAVRLFCEQRADPNAANAEGQTPMHVAYATFRKNAGGLARVLEEHGGDRAAKDAAGLTPEEIVDAAERREEEERREAVAAGEERRSRAKFRKAARQACDPEVAEWLAAHGLGHLEDAFGRRSVSLDEVPSLTPASLGKMGVDMAERPRVMEAVEARVAELEARRQEQEAEALREAAKSSAAAARTRYMIGLAIVAFFVAVFFFLRWVEQRGEPVRLGGKGRSYSESEYRRHEESQ